MRRKMEYYKVAERRGSIGDKENEFIMSIVFMMVVILLIDFFSLNLNILDL